MRIFLAKNLIKIFVAMLFIGCVYQTNNLVKYHFSHIDDIGVADTLINWNLCDTLEKKKEKYSEMSIVGKIYSFAASEDNCALYNNAYSFFSVPAHWTYAPFQFIFTNLLYKTVKWESYEDIKYLGRLPSFVAYTISAFIFYVFLGSEKFLGYKNIYIVFSLVLLLMFSAEFRIMAAQMHSYSIGVLASLLALGVFLYTPKEDSVYIDGPLKIALMYSLAISMQYQAIFLVIACLFAFFICEGGRIGYNAAIWSVLKISGWMVVFLMPILPFIFKNLGKGPGLYAEGADLEFVVKNDQALQRFLKFFEVITNNLNENIYALFSPVELDLVYAFIYGFVILVFFLIGLFDICKRRHESKFDRIFYFIISYIALMLVLIFSGIMTFSPTRHALFSIVPVLIVVGNGFLYLSDVFNKLKIDRLIFAGISVICCYSLINYESFAGPRVDGVNEEYVEKFFGNGAVDIIVGDGVEFKLMKNIKNNYYLINDLDVCSRIRSKLDKFSSLSIGIYLRSSFFISDKLNYIYSKCALDAGLLSVESLNILYANGGDSEVEFSKRTMNGDNSIYYYKLNLKNSRP